LESEELREKVHIIVAEMAREDKLKMNAVELENLANGVYDEMVGLGPLEVLLQDETVSDILINTHERVFVERRGELELSAVRFANEPHLLRIINRIVSQAGRRVDESQPLCDCRLMDGSRVNVAIAPIAVDGPLVSIRKFSKSPLTLDRLVEYNANANTPRDALTRLEQMVAMGDMKITPEAVAGQIASAVGLIVQATRLSDGQRKITSVRS